MILKEEVERIAKLARLELTEKETVKMQKDLSEILDYFNLLKEAPKLSKLAIEKGDLRATRKDEIISSHNIADKLISAFPEKKESFIKVKTIL